MPAETERKFLTNQLLTKELQKAPCQYLVQAYLYSDSKKTIRLRIISQRAFLTIKGATTGFTRPEFEYEIPIADAGEIIKLCGNIVEKVRYSIHYMNHFWEVDVFEGHNKGLIVAEIELSSENEVFAKPPWVESEVTGDERFYNSFLAQKPYKTWQST
jgi:adenylate cyclase